MYENIDNRIREPGNANEIKGGWSANKNELSIENTVMLKEDNFVVNPHLLKTAYDLMDSYNKKRNSYNNLGYNLGGYIKNIPKEGLLNSSNLSAAVLDAVKNNDKLSEYKKITLEVLGDKKDEIVDYFININPIVLHTGLSSQIDSLKVASFIKRHLDLAYLPYDLLADYEDDSSIKNDPDYQIFKNSLKTLDKDIHNSYLTEETQKEFKDKRKMSTIKYLLNAQKVIFHLVSTYQQLRDKYN